MNSPFSAIGVLTFSAFILVAILIRIGRNESPYRALARLHFVFTSVYVATTWLWYKTHPDASFSWSDWILGLYLYFALQYAFFTHIFATIIRGFSIGICVTLFQRGGRASLAEIQSSYGDGKGLDYVKNERIAVLIESDALVEKNGKLETTVFGRFTALLNRIILKVWNLNYLGIEKEESKS
jgi:hypothetical protein